MNYFTFYNKFNYYLNTVTSYHIIVVFLFFYCDCDFTMVRREAQPLALFKHFQFSFNVLYIKLHLHKKMVLKSHETLLLSFFFFGSPSKSDDDVHAFSGETFDD